VALRHPLVNRFQALEVHSHKGTRDIDILPRRRHRCRHTLSLAEERPGPDRSDVDGHLRHRTIADGDSDLLARSARSKNAACPCIR